MPEVSGGDGGDGDLRAAARGDAAARICRREFFDVGDIGDAPR